ncbi:MAG: TetR/AcrR family transcriptional regulator [Propioniciclava sp.]
MPKIVDHNERRDHIAEAVTNIVIRDGFDHVTMREIAAEAGYAHGAIARYFPDKQSILSATFVRVYTTSNERILAQVDGVRGLEALNRMCSVLLPFEQKGANESRVVLTFWDRASQDPALQSIHQQHITQRRNLIRRFLTEAAEDGELASHVNIDVAVNRVSVHNAGWQMLAVLMPESADDASLRASIDSMIDEFRRGDRD